MVFETQRDERVNLCCDKGTAIEWKTFAYLLVSGRV